MAIHKCPVCGTVLLKEKWEKALGVWKARQQHFQEREAKLQRENRELKKDRKKLREEGMKEGKRKEKRRADTLAKQVNGLLERENQQKKRIRDLERQLKQGTTPQLEGLLYEKELVKQLKAGFSHDEIQHTGKGGDVIQRVRVNGRVVGVIVFECKKVQKILKSHIDQTHQAIVQRKADFGILVTSGARARFGGFATERDVLIVNPAGVLCLAQLLRGHLIEQAKTKAGRTEREKAARQLFSYLESTQFKTQMRDLIDRARKLGEMLHDEVKAHERTWERRYQHYKAIFEESYSIGQSFSRILESQLGASRTPKLLPPARQYLSLPAFKTRRQARA